MTCKSVQQSLSAYIDRELSGGEMLQIRSHLHRCPACLAEETALRNLKRHIADAPTVEPPAGFELRLLEAIRNEQVAHKRSTVSLSTLVVVAAAAAAITFLSLPSGEHKGLPPEAKQDLAKTDVNWGVRMDQASFSGSDPLGGGRVILAASDERH